MNWQEEKGNWTPHDWYWVDDDGRIVHLSQSYRPRRSWLR